MTPFFVVIRLRTSTHPAFLVRTFIATYGPTCRRSLNTFLILDKTASRRENLGSLCGSRKFRQSWSNCRPSPVCFGSVSAITSWYRSTAVCSKNSQRSSPCVLVTQPTCRSSLMRVWRSTSPAWRGTSIPTIPISLSRLSFISRMTNLSKRTVPDYTLRKTETIETWGNGNDHVPPFRKVRHIPFHSNTMVGFFKTGRSFHGVDAIQQDQVMRHSLLIHVKARAEYFAELYGAENFLRVFSNRTAQDFAPVSESLRNCERVIERGIVDGSGRLLARANQ